MSWGAVLFFAVAFGIICAALAQRKNLGAGSHFVIGFFLGIIGLLITVFEKPGLPEAPPGMQAAKCTRCNAVNNVPKPAATFECWQCHQASPIMPGVRPEDNREWLDRIKRSDG